MKQVDLGTYTPLQQNHERPESIQRNVMSRRVAIALSALTLVCASFLSTGAASASGTLPGTQCDNLGDTSSYVAWTFSAKLKCTVSTYGNAWEIVSTSKIKPKTSNYIKPDGSSDTQYGVVLWGTCFPPYAMGWYQGEDEGQGENAYCTQAENDLTFRWRLANDMDAIQPGDYVEPISPNFTMPKTNGKIKAPIAVLAQAASQAIAHTPVTYMTCVADSACTPGTPAPIKCPLGAYVNTTNFDVPLNGKRYITKVFLCGVNNPAANQGSNG